MEKEYKRKCRIRIIYYIVLICCGGAAVILPNWFRQDIADVVASYYSIMGVGLIAAGVVSMFKTLRILKSAELTRKQAVAEGDERNRMVGLKSWSYAGYTMFLLLYAGMLIAGLFNFVVLQVLQVVLAVFALLLLGFRILLQRTM